MMNRIHRRVAFLLLTPSILPAFSFAQSDWYKKSATLGAGLTAAIARRVETSTDSTFSYALKATGFPAGGKVAFLSSNLSTSLPAEPGRTVTVGKTWGPLLVDGQGSVLHLDGTTFGVDIRNPQPGESFVITLMSLEKNQKIESFVKITPVPVESKDGSCYAEAILTNTAGASYEIRAEGFAAREQVLIAQDSGAKARQSKIKTEKDGSWILKIQTDGGGKSSGTLTTNISGQSCKLTLSLPWRPHK